VLVFINYYPETSSINFTVISMALVCLTLRSDGRVLSQLKLNRSKNVTLNSRLSGPFRSQNLSGIHRMQVLRSSVSTLTFWSRNFTFKF